MSLPIFSLPYEGSNLLFLEEVLPELEKRGIPPGRVLYRASEKEELRRILRFGTDRGGFAGEKAWECSGPSREEILHEDVIYATTEEDIRRGEREKEYSTSFKKFAIIQNPLVLVYGTDHLKKIGDRQYLFCHPQSKKDALLAIIVLNRLQEIPGWFREEEGLFYRSLAASVRGGTIVEVGSWKGRSTSYIGRACRANGSRLHCVDHWAGSTDEFREEYEEVTRQEDVYAAFVQNMRERDIDVVCHRTSSVDAAEGFKDSTIDLVFLDASHDIHAVQSDIEAWFKKVKIGGILGGHDYSSNHLGVRRAVDRWARTNNLHLCRGPGSIWYAKR